MAGLENQIKHLNLTGNQVINNRCLSNSPITNMKTIANRPAVPLPTGSPLVHLASPSILEGRPGSRPMMSGGSPTKLNRESQQFIQQQHTGSQQAYPQHPLQHQGKQPQQQTINQQQLQNYLLVQQQNAERVLAQQQKQTLLRNQQYQQQQRESVAFQQQRNAIAQQLVQKSQTNREASYNHMMNQQNQQISRTTQQQSAQPKTNHNGSPINQINSSQNNLQNSNYNRSNGSSPALNAQQQQIITQQQINNPGSGEVNSIALQEALNALQTARDQRETTESPFAGDRTYMNVQPVAVVGRNGRVMKPGDNNLKLSAGVAEDPKKTPAIPKSQEVKHKQEPLYSTILGIQGTGASGVGGSDTMFEDTAMYANYAPASFYSNYSNYSELDVLRSSDSHCSAEEEHTEGLPNLGDSPVSSSYSELRQAHQILASQFVGGTLPDGLYEPVIPPKGVGQGAPPGPQKHFKSLSNSSDQSSSDYFGTCVKCAARIVGEGSGCSAMGRLYHIQCFTCSECNCQLQGLPFYSVDGAALCHMDYLNTLEKCCKCIKPILDRILRATGKPYHPTCFTCLVCNKSLDGIPFTVDATNQIHCIEDFHRRFAPRCSVCQHPIMPTPGQEETVRVVALDRSFHIDCYRCVDCNLLLSSEEEGRGCYPLDNHVLCKQCNTRRIQALTSRITPD